MRDFAVAGVAAQEQVGIDQQRGHAGTGGVMKIQALVERRQYFHAAGGIGHQPQLAHEGRAGGGTVEGEKLGHQEAVEQQGGGWLAPPQGYGSERLILPAAGGLVGIKPPVALAEEVRAERVAVTGYPTLGQLVAAQQLAWLFVEQEALLYQIEHDLTHGGHWSVSAGGNGAVGLPDQVGLGEQVEQDAQAAFAKCPAGRGSRALFTRPRLALHEHKQVCVRVLEPRVASGIGVAQAVLAQLPAHLIGHVGSYQYPRLRGRVGPQSQQRRDVFQTFLFYLHGEDGIHTKRQRGLPVLVSGYPNSDSLAQHCFKGSFYPGEHDL